MKKIIFITTICLFITTIISADAKETAKAEITRQFKLLQEGDVTRLKARFTKRLRDRVTEAKVRQAQKEIKNYSVDTLVNSVIEGEYEGKKTIKIKMKNSRTLTILVEEGGEWYADTLWFK
jgi:hypothetical protein